MRLDLDALRSEITAHPWRSVALASVAGACVALARSRNVLVRAVADAAIAAVMAVGRELMREQTKRFTVGATVADA